MRLKTLVLQESNLAKMPKEIISFRWITHHVSEIYMCFLPKIDINNSSKITLEFGPQGNEVAFDDMLGCTNIFIEDFDFNNFFSSSTEERNLILINEIKENLISIYKRKNNNIEDIQSIISTADKVSRIGFNLDVVIDKLQKITKDRTKKIEIHRILNSDVGEAWKCMVVNKKDSLLLKEKWMTKIPDYLDRTDYFKKAELKDDNYIIYNNLGNIAFQVKIDHLSD